MTEITALESEGTKPSYASDLSEQWTGVQSRLQSEIGEAEYSYWIGPLKMVAMEKGRVTLSIPSRFQRDWLEQHYGRQLESAWAAENPSVLRVDILVESKSSSRSHQPIQSRPLSAVTNRSPRSDQAASDTARSVSTIVAGSQRSRETAESSLESVGAPLDPRYTFESFVVGKSNELAYAAARRVAEADAVPFNPLYLYGCSGLGKTHLMHAIAWEIRHTTPAKKVLYLSAEKFMYQFIRAVRFKDTMAFKQKFRTVDVLLVDDVQFIGGKNSTQDEFFHTFNALVDHNRQVILSADRPPAELDGIEDRIKSRLGWGLSADIHATDYELRLGILQSKCEQLLGRYSHVSMPDKVLEFLAYKIVSNVRELEGALNRVVAYSDLVGRPVSLEMAQDTLADILRANDRRTTIDDIQRRVAEYYNLRMSDLLSARRARVVARPRQVAMYLSKQLTTRSLPEIGRKFGGRDHTTVMHAIRKIEELKSIDSNIREDVDMLARMLES